jgi:hypothetical protein
VNLAEQLQAAKQREEILKLDAGDKRTAAEFAKRIQLPARELSADIRTRLDAFNKWAISKQARRCPAKPAAVALFILEQADLGVPVQHALAQINAIEQLHDRWSLANPVRTAIVRAALATFIKTDPPRSWPREDKVRFAELDPDIREIISKRENDRDKELRRLQNKVAADLQRQTATAPEAKPVADVEDKSNDDQKT